MSWSFSFSGPALDVARSAELELEKYRVPNEVEEALRSRAVHMVVVACHGMKDKTVYAIASGHCGPHGHVFSAVIQPIVVEESAPGETQKTEGTKEPAKAPAKSKKEPKGEESN